MDTAEGSADCSAVKEFKIRRHKKLHSFGCEWMLIIHTSSDVSL